jgi:hypothetical protein
MLFLLLLLLSSAIAAVSETGVIPAGSFLVIKERGALSVSPKLTAGVFVTQPTEDSSFLQLRMMRVQSCIANHSTSDLRLLQHLKAQPKPELQSEDPLKLSYIFVDNCEQQGEKQYSIAILGEGNELGSWEVFYVSASLAAVYLIMLMGFILKKLIVFKFQRSILVFSGALMASFFSLLLTIAVVHTSAWVVGVCDAFVKGGLAFLLLDFFRFEMKRSVAFGAVFGVLCLSAFISNVYAGMFAFLLISICSLFMELFCLYLVLHFPIRIYFWILAGVITLWFLLFFNWVAFFNPYSTSLLIWLIGKYVLDVKMAVILAYLCFVL